MSLDDEPGYCVEAPGLFDEIIANAIIVVQISGGETGSSRSTGKISRHSDDRSVKAGYSVKEQQR